MQLKSPIKQIPFGARGVYEFQHTPKDAISFQDFHEQEKKQQDYLKGKQPEEIESLVLNIIFSFGTALPTLPPYMGLIWFIQ